MSNRNYNSIPSDREAQPIDSPTRPRLHRIVGAIVLLVAGAAIAGTTIALVGKNEPAPQNVIMMISDGFGPASEAYARQYYSWDKGLGYKAMLPLDTILVGSSRTQSSSSMITDSAAGATAFACAQKSYNGAIGVDSKGVPCGTVLESAKLHRNMLTGLVVTSRITHATPASFSAHVLGRDSENDIASQQIGFNPLGRTVDLMFGGGACEFTSNLTENSCRFDTRDLFKEANESFGWTVKRTRQDFDEIKAEDVELPLMGLFAPDHLSYEIDRDSSEQPSLKEMTKKALKILNIASKKQGTGFFMMIEGSRIDMAAHTNDPAAHVHEIYEYNQAIQAVKEFVDANPNTVVISTSDHETGGFTIGRQIGEGYPEYKWNPDVIKRVNRSCQYLAGVWRKEIDDSDDDLSANIKEFLVTVILRDGLGIDNPTDDELKRLLSWKGSNKWTEELAYDLTDMVSRRALLGWATHGHTAVDVNLYAYGYQSEKLRGNHENTDIGDFIAEQLKLDLEDVTERLKR
ncbi:alkaline-phosphatase-like protein [Phycomyces nitens]|nr:alkaline-phosphatase-like protein [Phycomyces nitens]